MAMVLLYHEQQQQQPSGSRVISVSHTAPFDISMNMDRVASNAAVVFDRLDAFVQYPINAGAGGGPAHAGQQDGSGSTAALPHARLSQRSRGDFATVYGGKDGWVYNNLPPSPFAAEVYNLIRLSSSPDNLCQMTPTWHPWF
jgi:hypothetical protein